MPNATLPRTSLRCKCPNASAICKASASSARHETHLERVRNQRIVLHLSAPADGTPPPLGRNVIL